MNTLKINHFCNQCKKDKLLSEFSKTEANKAYSRCKKCVSDYNKIYRDENKNKHKQYKQNYYINNKKVIQEKHKLYKQNNYDNIAQYKKDYYLENKEKINEYHRKYSKERQLNDINFKLRISLSKYISIGLKKRNLSKNGKSIMNVLPYTIQDLKEHLEKQFEPWMTWDNQGAYNKKIWDDNDQLTWTWQIDHIVPHSTFNYISMDDENFQKCWMLDNLRPLSAKQNILDGNRR